MKTSKELQNKAAAGKENYRYQLVDRNNVLSQCEAETLGEAIKTLGDDLVVEYEFHFAATVRNDRRGHVFLVQWQPTTETGKPNPGPVALKTQHLGRGAGRPSKDRVPAAGHIQLRVTKQRKNCWVGAAHPKSLAQWMTENLDKASHYESLE